MLYAACTHVHTRALLTGSDGPAGSLEGLTNNEGIGEAEGDDARAHPPCAPQHCLGVMLVRHDKGAMSPGKGGPPPCTSRPMRCLRWCQPPLRPLSSLWGG